jgi:Flp pilus assembly pilin Flp
MYKLLIEEQGTAAIEYALLISVIGMGLAGVLLALGINVFDALGSINEVLSPVQLNDTQVTRK